MDLHLTRGNGIQTVRRGDPPPQWIEQLARWQAEGRTSVGTSLKGPRG